MKFFWIISLVLPAQLLAAETDQFYARDAVIRDSAAELNGYFHQRIELALNKINNSKKTFECRDVASEVLVQVLGEFNLKAYTKDRTFSKVSKFTQDDPSVDRFPEDTLEEKKYREDSIYKNRPFPVNIVGVARSINVDGIYMGTDKIGHFSIVGKAYYKNFLEALNDGNTLEKSTEIAIFKGYKQEVAILGYTVGGTLSYGDLEANYQGLMFGRNMCEGSQPHLAKQNGEWIHNPKNLFDIKQYVNPKYDEAYNVSLWSKRMWRKMKVEIIKGYCVNRSNENFIARSKSYGPRVQKNFNDEMIEKFLIKNPKFDRKSQLLSPAIKCE
ncbi:MAG: hypothetical protein HOP07_17335 [Bacteriovoracaceae bacterium]|nr:hypothetical protein [Bacteriovoracaceae bacterium]